MQDNEATSKSTISSTQENLISENSPTTISLTSTPTISISLPLNTPESNNEASEFGASSITSQVTSGHIQDVWWSDDSSFLYFSILYEGNVAYDLQSQSITKINVEEVLGQTPQVGILDQLPPYYHPSLHISPSKTRAIYILQSDIPPSPTADVNIEGGEMLSPSYELEMWLWENGNSSSLGKIKQCWLSDSFWSDDEQKVILVEFGIPIPSCFDSTISPQAWLLNLEGKTVYPLFSSSEYPPLQVYGFSSDGEHLLYGFYSDRTGANLALLDIETLNSSLIDAPVNNFLHWIDRTKILIQYRNDGESPPYPVGILDLRSLQFCDLLTMFEGKYIRYINLSPNKQWLAFTVGQQFYTPETLWLMEFDAASCASS